MSIYPYFDDVATVPRRLLPETISDWRGSLLTKKDELHVTQTWELFVHLLRLTWKSSFNCWARRDNGVRLLSNTLEGMFSYWFRRQKVFSAAVVSSGVVHTLLVYILHVVPKKLNALKFQSILTPYVSSPLGIWWRTHQKLSARACSSVPYSFVLS